MVQAQLGGQPILILSEDVIRQKGKDAQKNNIAACKAIADAVRTTLGPKGMDKMLVDSIGDVVITNDGVTILEEMEIEHPAAKMMVEVAKTQDEEVGDGTTTAVVLAGELLKKSESLFDQELHPTVVAKGYRMAKEKAIEVLNKISVPININDEKALENVAITAMTGKGAESSKEKLAKITVAAVKQVGRKLDGVYEIDMEDIKIEKKQGGSIEDTELIKGIVIDKEKVHPAMSSKVNNAKIALLDTALEIKETETDAEIRITDPAKLQEFIEQEEATLLRMVESVEKSGANVLFCQKGIDDLAQHYLAKKGILAVRRVKKSDMEKLSRATGATIVTSLKDLSEKDLGKAGVVEQKKVGDENMIFVRECENPKAVTVLVRGGTEHVVDEAERALEDAIGGVISALKFGKVVGGGGASEVEVAKRLRDFASEVGGREQLAINAFADALEAIPRTLAENSGLDQVDMLVELRNKHNNNITWAGIDVEKGQVRDLFKEGVIEPLQIKVQAIKSAAEATELILRIDDVIASSGGKEKTPGAGGETSEDFDGE